MTKIDYAEKIHALVSRVHASHLMTPDDVSLLEEVASLLKHMTALSFASHIRKFMGQPIAVMCARYQYRGVVAEVGDDFVVLNNATMVEISGTNSLAKAHTEDPFAGFVTISLLAVEQISQPNWVHAPVPGKA